MYNPSAIPMYQQLYGFTLLDDLHNFYPEILYGNPDQWQDVPQLIRYIQSQTLNRFNLYTRGTQQWSATQPHVQAHVQANVQANVPANVQEPVRNSIPLVTPQRRERVRIPPNAPARHENAILRRHIRIPPPGNSPAYLSEGEEDDLDDTTHIATSLLQTIQNMMIVQDPHTTSIQRLFENSAIPVRTNIVYTNLNDVPIIPTLGEISRATRTYNATTADTVADDVCAICQENYTDGQPIRCIMHCDHKFHKTCIDTWFGRNVHCPVCRHDIRGEYDN